MNLPTSASAARKRNITHCKQQVLLLISNISIFYEVWDECLKSVHDCSVNVRHCLIQFKTVHRLYYSREKLHSFFPDVSSICNRCKSMTGNLMHSFWLCSKLYTYWKSIFHCFSTAYGKCWEPDPFVAILGATAPLSSANKYEKKAILFGTVIAKKIILRGWKSDIAPTYDQWLREMANMLHLERLRLHNEDRGDIFDRMWDPVLQLFQGKD